MGGLEEERRGVCVWGIKGKKKVEGLWMGENVREWKKNCVYKRMLEMVFMGNMKKEVWGLGGGWGI